MSFLREANYITLTKLHNHHHDPIGKNMAHSTSSATDKSSKITLTRWRLWETPDVVGALFGQTEGLHFISQM